MPSYLEMSGIVTAVYLRCSAKCFNEYVKIFNNMQ